MGKSYQMSNNTTMLTSLKNKQDWDQKHLEVKNKIEEKIRHSEEKLEQAKRENQIISETFDKNQREHQKLNDTVKTLVSEKNKLEETDKNMVNECKGLYNKINE